MVSPRSIDLPDPPAASAPLSAPHHAPQPPTRNRHSDRLRVALLAFGVATLTVGLLATTSYCVGRNTASDLRFFEPRRPPTTDEALVACPVEYALRSDEYNDVIFLGDSTCRVGIDALRFEKLTGLRAFNLGSQGLIGPMGFLITGKGYLAKHPRPRLVVLCVAPIAFENGSDEIAQRKGTTMQARFEANYGPEVPGLIPVQDSVRYFIQRGSLAAYAGVFELFQARADVRDIPVTGVRAGQPPMSFHAIQVGVLQNRGFCPVPGEHQGREAIDAPGEPARIHPEWDRSVRMLAETCQSLGLPLLIRFSPMPSDLLHVKEFSPIERWSRDLESAYPHVHIGHPTLLWYDPNLCWDHMHLNARGVAVYMDHITKEILEVLDQQPSQGQE